MFKDLILERLVDGPKALDELVMSFETAPEGVRPLNVPLESLQGAMTVDADGVAYLRGGLREQLSIALAELVAGGLIEAFKRPGKRSAYRCVV